MAEAHACPKEPFEDRRSWRLLLARLHPDAGGDHELFLFACALKDEVCRKGSLATDRRRASLSRRGGARWAPGRATGTRSRDPTRLEVGGRGTPSSARVTVGPTADPAVASPV